MKIHIEKFPNSRKPNLEKPIEIENIEFYKNKKNQWVVYFDSKNHKYLDVKYNTTCSHIDGDYCKFGSARGFEIETCESWKTSRKWDDEEYDVELPEDRMRLFLIPESDEEDKELSGVAAILPNKWSYCICIVPYEDFENEQ